MVPGPINTRWGPGLVYTNWGPGPVNANWGLGLVIINLGSGPVNTNWGPGPGAGGREIQTPKFVAFYMKEIFVAFYITIRMYS